MKYRKITTLILSAFMVFSCSGQNFEQNLTVQENSNALSHKIDSIVINKMNNYNIPGLSIGIVKNDSILYCNGYGVKNINTTDVITEISNFHAASISKLFTAQAIILLVNKNLLSLDDKLSEIAPELNFKDKNAKDITIASLLNHTSGLPDVGNYNWKNNNQSSESLKSYVLDINLKLKYAPFTKYYYSNLGYNILGYVIEKVSNTNFDRFIKEMILEPNEMLNSDFRYFKIIDSLRTSPHGQKRISKNIYVRKTYPYTREQAPSSTLNSSSRDLSKWMISILKEINNSKTESIYYNMTESSFSTYPYIGLGFQLGSFNGLKTIGHYGGDRGYRSYLLMIPEKQIGLILLANCDYNEDFRQEILHPITKILLDE